MAATEDLDQQYERESVELRQVAQRVAVARDEMRMLEDDHQRRVGRLQIMAEIRSRAPATPVSPKPRQARARRS